MTRYIANADHYSQVLAHCADVKHTLWIGTADIKDAYVEERRAGRQPESVPFLKVLSRLVERGVEVRLIHAKEPGPAFREDFDRYPALIQGLERVICPRVHFKMIVFDCQEVYVGSANLTGAGIGMKGEGTRNFESGILTDDSTLVDQAMDQFDRVWMGRMCKGCKRREYCGDPIDKI